MDTVDRQLLTRIQKDLPITSRPYDDLGRELGISGEEVIERLEGLKNSGMIRRIGGVFDSRKLGYYSTLCALVVPEEDLEKISKVINELPGVTHNYIRNHHYNMWFTLIGPSKETVEEMLEKIRKQTGITSMLNLPAVKFFKINVQFNLYTATSS